jgi:hypothetical protein
MEAAVFMALAYRLPAYSGAMAAAAMRQARDSGGGSRRPARDRPQQYERTSGMANKARTADSAPAATPEALAGLNAQLGGGWFSVRKVKAGESPDGGAR